jgi:hypothetical protein
MITMTLLPAEDKDNFSIDPDLYTYKSKKISKVVPVLN